MKKIPTVVLASDITTEQLVVGSISRRNKRRVGGLTSKQKKLRGRKCAQCPKWFVPLNKTYYHCSEECAAAGLRKRYNF